MNELIRSVFLSAFGSPSEGVQNDAAVLEVPPGRLAMTTDSFVVQPLEFPGGSIGSLAVHGTVNDLAMSGAEPLYLTAGFILEEGLPLKVLTRVAQFFNQLPDFLLHKPLIEFGKRPLTEDPYFPQFPSSPCGFEERFPHPAHSEPCLRER